MTGMMINLQMDRLIDAAIKLSLALLCGGVLGIERGRRKRPAGFRTYMLVCLGATLVMMTNQYICLTYHTGDPSRMGAQVISGIGFLGAGTIITTVHNRVKGLTTAAGLWASACVGLALGIGYYEGALIGTALIFIAMVSMHRLDTYFVTSFRHIVLYVEVERIKTIKKLLELFRERNIQVIELETEHPKKHGTATLITLRLPSKKMKEMLNDMVNSVDGVVYVEEI